MSNVYRIVFKKIWRLVFSILLVTVGGILVSCSALIPVTGGPTNTPVPTTPPDIGNITVNLKDISDQSTVFNGVVRVAGTSLADDLDYGEYRIGPCENTQLLVAWAPGYKTSFVPCDGQITSYDIPLIKLDTFDNPNYSWVPAGIETDPMPNCAGCHAGQRDPSHNEFGEWRKSGHAKVTYDRYFETVYLGINLSGYRSQDTIWDIIDSQLVRRAPIVDANYRGPGYKLDYPSKNGNCAYCHVPASVGASQTEVNLAQYLPNPGGSIGEGITCDVCHKVIGVQLDDSGFPYVDRPGILSFQFLRPRDINERLYSGPFASLAPVNGSGHSSTCFSVFSQSEFCAACHYGKFSNMLIYGSYSEWRDSEYGHDPTSSAYQTCQDCHMSPSHNVIKDSASSQRQACSAENLSYRDFDHNMLNWGVDPDTNREIPQMIKNAAVVNAEFNYDPGKKNWLTVTAKVRSKDVGHRFPTDSPLRHLILIIEVKDQREQLLSQVDGERIPIWGGAGDVAYQDPNVKLYSGLPGKIFANLLAEEDTGVSPTIAFWNETKYAWIGDLRENGYDYSDTRLIPGIVDNSKYSFDIPDRGNVTVTLRLIYRFAFYDLMRQKGWNNRPDILVTSKTWNCSRRENPTRFDCNVPE